MSRLHMICVALLTLSGCATARPAPRATLPPDSVELLRVALARVKPAFEHQSEALQSGIYGQGAAAAEPPSVPLSPPIEMPPVEPAEAPVATVSPVIPPPPAPSGGAHRFVIQVAAFGDETSATAAASQAGEAFPDLIAAVEAANGWYRVVLSGWPDAEAARRMLRGIQARYPDAWVRASVP